MILIYNLIPILSCLSILYTLCVDIPCFFSVCFCPLPHLSSSLPFSLTCFFFPIDDNECDLSPCVADSVCMDTAGSFVCSCAPGYVGDQVSGCQGKQ